MKTHHIIGILLAVVLLIGCGTTYPGGSSGGHTHIVQKVNTTGTIQK